MRKFLLLLMCLVCLCAAANADGLYFINPEGGTMLHADPFCPSVSVKFLPLTPIPEDAGEFVPCHTCWIQFAIPEKDESAEAAEPAETVWYYNPDGGIYRHSDPNCKTIHSRYLPLTGTFTEGDPDFDHLKTCVFCGYETSEETVYQDCLYMKSLAIKAASQPGVWGMPEASHVHADVAEETALIALRGDYPIPEPTDFKTAITTFFYPKGASGHDTAHYLVCVMEIGGLETLENWDLLFYATVDAETGAVRTFKGE
ncbi:MAG: hypothetical protein IKK21_10860 [Clostridia bacterium]|nr:hypothetical protein [Clostridia bacterium]